jgi:1-acyl-sn-glycerol-3-phosphate acyltransferase
VSVSIFPEGTRARKGDLAPFKSAGSIALLDAAPALAVVPVAIDGSWRLLSHKLLPVPFGVRIRVHIGAPVPRGEAKDNPAILDHARADIEETLNRWRKG